MRTYNPNMNYSSQLKALQDKHRAEYNQVMSEISNAYNQSIQALQQQFINPSVGPSPVMPPVPPTTGESEGTDNGNGLQLQMLSIMGEIRTQLSTLNENITKLVPSSETQVDKPVVVEEAKEEPKENKNLKTK